MNMSPLEVASPSPVVINRLPPVCEVDFPDIIRKVPPVINEEPPDERTRSPPEPLSPDPTDM
jgi:hypothetical protein